MNKATEIAEMSSRKPNDSLEMLRSWDGNTRVTSLLALCSALPTNHCELTGAASVPGPIKNEIKKLRNFS